MLSKIPHWVVGDQHYTNQFQTWQAIANTGLPARFYLYEEAFDQLDWTTNPKESWDELLRIRCIQLRQKYKNLKLLYSGGRDSHCILRAFVKNQIPIDELLIVDYSRNPVRTAEFKSWIQPMAHRYKQHNPQVKITTLTIGINEYKKWFGETWTENLTSTLPSGFFQPSDYSWMIEQQCRVPDSSTGIMCGLEKPELELIDNKIYSTNTDRAFLHYFNSQTIMEFFYISPDLPELHLKQCWLMVEYLKAHYPKADSKFFDDFQYYRGDYYDEFAISAGRGPAVDVTCPSQNGKGKYSGTHPVFQVLKKIIRNEAPKVWEHYQENLNWFYKNSPISVDQSQDSFWRGAKQIKGKYYFICDWPA